MRWRLTGLQPKAAKPDDVRVLLDYIDVLRACLTRIYQLCGTHIEIPELGADNRDFQQALMDASGRLQEVEGLVRGILK